MKVGIPVWQSRVSPVFDCAERLLVVTVEHNAEASRIVESIAGPFISQKVGIINSLGINVLICGAISRPFALLIASSGVSIIPWISGQVDEVIRAFLEGELSDPRFLMPGCCRHGRSRRSGGGPGKRHRGPRSGPWWADL